MEIGLEDGVADGVADNVAARLTAGCVPVFFAVVVVVAPNSELLAGTSWRKVAKISLSSGWVPTTFALSNGTTSERGKFGSVKKAIWLDGMPRSDCPRS